MHRHLDAVGLDREGAGRGNRCDVEVLVEGQRERVARSPHHAARRDRRGGVGDGGIVGDREVLEGHGFVAGDIRNDRAGVGHLVAHGHDLAHADRGRQIQEQRVKKSACRDSHGLHRHLDAVDLDGERTARGNPARREVEVLVEGECERAAMCPHLGARRDRRDSVRGGIVVDLKVGEGQRVVAGGVLDHRAGLGHGIANRDRLALLDRSGRQSQG